MIVTVDPVAYSGIVLHAIKYSAKGVCGLLLGSKDAKGIKVSGIVPVTHESNPLAPTFEIALSLIGAQSNNVVGAYFANPNYQDKSLSPYAARVAERIAGNGGGSPLLVQVLNWELNSDCLSNCLGAHTKDGEQWKDVKLSPEGSCLRTLASAIEHQLHRAFSDVENHLEKPECDFFNTALNAKLKELSSHS